LNTKVVIITGATSGIGLEMTKMLAQMGFRIVMACRNIDKASRIREELLNRYEGCSVDIMKVDMASFKSIEDFVQEYNSKYHKLDVLINNAGVFCDSLKKTEDNFEMTMGVNYLGSVLLTRLLLPTIIKTPCARIVNITSKSGFYGKLKVNKDTFTSNMHGFKAYSASKLAQILFTIDLAEEIRETGISVIAAYPGRVSTNIWKGKTLLMKIVSPIMNRKGITAEEGARTGVYVATSAKIKYASGKMFYNEDEMEYNKVCLDEALRKSLMQYTYEVISRI